MRINDIYFSDMYVTPNKEAYIPDKKTRFGLIRFEPEDFEEFYNLIESSYKGNSSYSVIYEEVFFRVERSMTMYGPQFCMRKMPKEVPPFARLGYETPLMSHLVSLSSASGLLVWAGATGSGKTTAISSLLKEFLTRDGGFAYTIEDPAEMPLDGEYKAMNGSVGLCKQTLVENDDWGSCLKSALRSKPRYVYVGEIRTPECASECLRAATSGHLVLSSVHANNVTDAITSIVKYAASGGLSEDLAYELTARGILGVVHQTLLGTERKFPNVSYLFANPDTNQGDVVRATIRSGKLNLATQIEQQKVRLMQRQPLF